MELAIIKREIIGDNAQNETETVAKYEIMDGAPVKGESIPIRLFLGAYNLTPTMRDIQKKFSCKYYLNLVLVDEEERRYFKQQEIVLWRKADKYKSKQERSDQMQVYEPTQSQFGRRESTNGDGNGGKGQNTTKGTSNGSMTGSNGNRKPTRIRHDENGDLLDDDDDSAENNSEEEAPIKNKIPNSISNNSRVNNNANNQRVQQQRDEDSD